MHVRDLHYFAIVAQELSFTKATTERLIVSQPALSKQIRQLEKSLQVKLFDRDHRTVRLTRPARRYCRLGPIPGVPFRAQA